MKSLLGAFVLLLTALTAIADDGAQRMAAIGDLTLENGQTIRDCRIGYRTYGALNATRSNAIVLTTWFAGKSAGMASWIGPGNVFDSSKYFIVTIDALGDGVSSSPSNSSAQPGAQFPQFTMRDMVRSQHQLLIRELKLDHVYAIGGLSMGGMQTFQWVFSYPEFMDKAVAVVGTPKQTSRDLLLWKTELDVIESLRDVPGGSARALDVLADINEMNLVTPEYTVEHTSAAAVDNAMKTHREALRKLNTFDYAAQLRAMIGHDVYRDFGGSAEAAARALKPKMLVVVSLQDQTVNPTPAREFARIAKLPLVTLTSDCGHLATGCEKDVLQREVWRFLETKQ